MYILKNAWKSVIRAKCRSILIGIVALVIATAACIALSIRQAASTTKEQAQEDMSITAQLSYDRGSAMEQMQNGETPGKMDFSAFSAENNALTLEDYLSYTGMLGENDSYYYTRTASCNAGNGLTAYSDEAQTEEDTVTQEEPEQGGSAPEMHGGVNGDPREMPGFTAKGDFILESFSSDAAMLSLFGTDGTCTIKDGAVFEEGTEDMVCLISEELAAYNDGLAVGDTFTLTNPSNEEECYTLSICGIYSNQAAVESGTRFMEKTDQANYIYMSDGTLENILTESAANSIAVIDDFGNETVSTLTTELNFTYAFSDTESYDAFCQAAEEKGLPENYTIMSPDLAAFESSLLPLENLSTMAGWFLLVVLIVGAVVLIVLNIFNIRERKYEIGVLAAIGMKKGKIALQFVTELFFVVAAAVLIGAVTGACTSVPITNALLSNQVESTATTEMQIGENFGREGNFGGKGDAPGDSAMQESEKMQDRPDSMFTRMTNGAGNYIDSVSSATDLTVVLELIAAGILLTLISSGAAVVTILRYEPLQILSNRN